LTQLAKVTAWTGYSIALMGEGTCQSVVEPLGPALDPPQVFKEAESWFTKAIGYAQTAGTAADPELNLARVGRERTRHACRCALAFDATCHGDCTRSVACAWRFGDTG